MIDLHLAETTPAHAVRVSVTAGCNPVRVAASPDGRTVWVTARESNALLAFSTSRLLTSPAQALAADVLVGQAPVPLTLVNHGQDVIVGNSNRFNRIGSQAELTVVNARAALAKKPAVLGSLHTGPFPREAALGSGGVLLVVNSGSEEIEAVNTRDLGGSATRPPAPSRRPAMLRYCASVERPMTGRARRLGRLMSLGAVCCVRPTAEEQAAFLDAIDELARVLIAGYGIGPAKAI